jgi:hypothetical protein
VNARSACVDRWTRPWPSLMLPQLLNPAPDGVVARGRMGACLRWRSGQDEKAPPLNSMQATDGACEAGGEGAIGARSRGRRLGFTGGGGDVVTQHITACCSMQVVDITLVKYHFTNITSLRVVQQKHTGLYSST